MKHRSFQVFILFFFFSVLFAGNVFAGKVSIIDARHYSNVFGEIRNYRIFLPPGYYEHPDKKYPVIYFLHGWAQRYFGSAFKKYAEYDKDNENNGDNIANFVSAHDAIVVKSDGYNRGEGEEYYLRPYNISPVETYRQFPIYFPELVDHIDVAYRTLANREHRAISGLSMGGFMAFMIGGKYPHLFSAVGSFCGSPEFVIGPKDFPFEYRHLDMYKNYGSQYVRLNFGDKDFIRGYHEDMNRFWPQVMDHYSFKIYPGEHTTSGLGEMFDFFFNIFRNPPPRPLTWDHIDVYPEFSVWDYMVKTDRDTPGVTILEDVNKRGFKCSVREFLPDGQLIPDVSVSVITAPVYEKNQLYTVNDINLRTLKSSRKTVRSNDEGKLVISFNGGIHEIGINKKADKPNIVIAGIEISNMGWAVHGKDVAISLKLVNKGLSEAKDVSAILSAGDNNIKLVKGDVLFGNIDINGIPVSAAPFVFQSQNDSIEMIKFKLTLRDRNKNEWTDFFEIPVKKDLPEIKDFEIADGKTFTVVKGGGGSETIAIGYGNGDGIANPGESIEILAKEKGQYWRTNLFSADRYVNPYGINIRKSDEWGTFDNVGASAKYTIPLLSSDCPEGHTITFFAEYWFAERPLHIIKQGKASVTVTGEDHTPPVIEGVKISGDNTLRAKIYDGSKISSVIATITGKDNRSFKIDLKDDGEMGDKVPGDQLFSRTVPSQEFNFYRIAIEAVDSLGNRRQQEVTGPFVLH